MRPRTLFGRLTVFLCTLSIALCATRLLLPAQPGAFVDRVPQPLCAADFNVQLVTLDRRARVLHLRLTAVRPTPAPAPTRLWLTTDLFTPDAPGQLWAGAPVEVRQPFAQAANGPLEVTLACGALCAAPAGAPAANYYARVHLTARADNTASGRTDFDIATAAPVVVEHDEPQAVGGAFGRSATGR